VIAKAKRDDDAASSEGRELTRSEIRVSVLYWREEEKPAANSLVLMVLLVVRRTLTFSPVDQGRLRSSAG
jgi:hypothetical protein